MSSQVHETKTNAIFKKGSRCCSQLRALATVQKESEIPQPRTHLNPGKKQLGFFILRRSRGILSEE
jgi:hypothetical protein